MLAEVKLCAQTFRAENRRFSVGRVRGEFGGCAYGLSAAAFGHGFALYVIPARDATRYVAERMGWVRIKNAARMSS